MAWAGSPVWVSTVASGWARLDRGFMAARTRSGPPVVMPPSKPPERPVRRV